MTKDFLYSYFQRINTENMGIFKCCIHNSSGVSITIISGLSETIIHFFFVKKARHISTPTTSIMCLKRPSTIPPRTAMRREGPANLDANDVTLMSMMCALRRLCRSRRLP